MTEFSFLGEVSPLMKQNVNILQHPVIIYVYIYIFKIKIIIRRL